MSRVPPGAPILTAAQMRAAEQAVFDAGVSQFDLMERAGIAVAREVMRFVQGRPVLVLAGPGNNGGDGYVVARHLREQGVDVAVAALGGSKAGAAAEMRALWEGAVVSLREAEVRPVLVDGLFGTGMTRPLDTGIADELRRLVAGAAITVAIDLPSGVDTDSGALLGAAGADVTVALGALKPAHVLIPAAGFCGTVFLADIGISASASGSTLARPRLAAPPLDSHKYSRGLVLVVEGVMPGAARLAARAALVGGAGYVILAGSGEARQGPDAIVHRRAVDAVALRELLADERIAAVVVGPGLGRDAHAEALLAACIDAPHALVLDGDALSLAGHAIGERLADRTAPAWLTPHAGEFGRMFASGDDKIRATRAAAAAVGAHIVHKGPDTVIAAPGGEVRISLAPSSWLSTAGTGDVLAGLLGARVATGCGHPAEAAVWLHGRAARIAGASFAADGLISYIPQAVAECL